MYEKSKLVNCIFHLLMVLSLCTTLLNGQRTITNRCENIPTNLNDYWQNLTLIFDQHVQSKSVQYIQQWNKLLQTSSIQNSVSGKCLSVIEHIIRRPIDQEWTAKMIDSNNLFPPGMLSGTMTELGDFDQCLSISGQHDHNPLVGKYCLATINLPRDRLFQSIQINRTLLQHPWLAEVIERWYDNDNFYSFTTAVCFPSICQPEEIKQILLSYFDVLNYFDFNVAYCQSKEDPAVYDSKIWIAVAILVVPCFFVIIGTIMDFSFGSKCMETRVGQFFVAFSWLSNHRALFMIKDNNNNPSMRRFQFIHGIRAIASIFIVMAHSGGLIFVNAFMRVSVLARHPTDIVEGSQMLVSQPFYNGALLVLTFFLISGLLVTYLTASSRKLKLNFLQYFFLRYFRFTPPLIGMICMTICLEFIGNGPLYHHDLLWPTLKQCYEKWWTHIFYISNFFNFLEMCGIQTWYLSTEMQLHVIGFIILALYVRSQRLTYITCLVFIGFGMVGIVMMVALGYTNIPIIHTVIYTKYRIRSDAAQFIFFAIPMQMIAYFIGAIIGLLALENKQINFTKVQNRLIWIGSVLILLLLPISSYFVADNPDKVAGDDTIFNAILFAFNVLLWSLANGWLVYQCTIDQNSLLSKFLSAKVFQPFSRISFGIYLCHLMTIWYNAHQTRTTISLASMNETYKIMCTSIIQSFMLAYFLFITFEAPSVNMIKFFVKRNHTHIPVPNNNNNNTTSTTVTDSTISHEIMMKKVNKRKKNGKQANKKDHNHNEALSEESEFLDSKNSDCHGLVEMNPIKPN